MLPLERKFSFPLAVITITSTCPPPMLAISVFGHKRRVGVKSDSLLAFLKMVENCSEEPKGKIQKASENVLLKKRKLFTLLL
jgi:hypothetical protein